MAVVIGIGNAGPSKITTVRRQMRTHDERTSGAWTCGCETIPMAAGKNPEDYMLHSEDEKELILYNKKEKRLEAVEK